MRVFDFSGIFPPHGDEGFHPDAGERAFMSRKRKAVEEAGAGRLRLTEALGVHGWAHIDPVLLAALATESPVLLVGPHGTAKSHLVERVAAALAQELRHYNAALLNYDDLVGIPLPDDSGQLRFAHTPGALWDAEFVFFDEISRCRADLQNKLFPIVHERKVLGLPLERLRHRWAAMNPPAAEDDEPGKEQLTSYLGSEPLDPALADRFPFVVTVPSWGDLDKSQREAVVLGREVPRGDGGEAWLTGLVDRCAEQLPAVEASLEALGSAYVLALADRLERASLPLSPRRCRMLFRSFAAVHAARLVLGGGPCALEDSAWLAVQTGLPQLAEPFPPAKSKLLAIHASAWEVAGIEEDSPWRKVLEEPDPLRRVRLAHELGLPDADVSRLVTRALGDQPHDAARVAAAMTMFLAFSETRDLTPAAWEPLARLASRVLEPRWVSDRVAPGADLECWRKISAYLACLPEGDPATPLVRNYLVGGFPDLWRATDWQAAVTRFLALRAEFAPAAGGAR